MRAIPSIANAIRREDGILPNIERYYTDFPMFFKFFAHCRIYLDYASSTPVDARMHRTFPKLSQTVIGANPSALHTEGVHARKAINDARALVAKTLNAHSDEIIFTSGATESDNLALVGAIEGFLKKGIVLSDIAVITSVLEHAAVLEPLAPYKDKGLFTMTIPAQHGVIDPKHIMIPESAKAVIVSIMYVNNEIGTVQPIKDIAKRVRKLRKEYPDKTILFHTDATQAPLYFNLRVDQLGVDMMTLGATKLYTHKGVGVLYKKRNVNLAPILRGGGQEKGLRPGTEPVELIHNFAHALAYAQERREEEAKRITDLQTYFEATLVQERPVHITAKGSPRSPHISHVAIKDFDSELLVIELDAKGIAVSAKSACKNEEDQESSIVESIYGKGWGAVRFSFGRKTREGDLDRAVRVLRKTIDKYKK
jgi:cysteine desulfurase